MSTVAPSSKAQANVPSGSIAPKTILKSTYSSVIAALEDDSKIILITGSSNKGKTALLFTINKNIAANHRIITLSGKDLPSIDTSKNSSHTELSTMKDFIFESTDLKDKLVVILDDAHCLPISFLSELIEGIKNSNKSTSHLQLILSGPVNFKDQLLAIEQINSEDFLHYTIDDLSDEEIKSYIKSKDYKISSNIKQLTFGPDSISVISDFIRSDQKLLDVILEWCAAIVKKDQLTSMSSQVVNQAASFAQQFSKDKDLPLSNSYPPFHEVYKYINDIQSSKKPSTKTDENSKKVPKNSVRKIATSKTASQKTKIPTITANTEPKTILKEIKNPSGYTKNDIEVMPANRTPKAKLDQDHKKSFPAAIGIAIFFLIGFITFIAFQIGSNSKVDDLPEQIVSEEIPTEESISTQNAIDDQSNNEIVLSKSTNGSEQDSHKINNQNSTTTEALALTTNRDNPEEATPTSQKPATQVANGFEQDTKITETNEQSPAPIIIEKKIELGNVGETEQITPQVEKTGEKERLLKIELSDLLIQAKLQLDNKKLSTPAGDNALETYQKILAKFPNNQDAIKGIKNVHDKYLGWANYYLKRNELGRAKNFYNKALGIDPSNSYAIKNLQVIAQQEAVANTALNNETASVNLNSQQSNQTKEIQSLLIDANEKMQQINSDIRENNRNYKTYQEAQTAFQEVLRSAPQNTQALKGLVEIKEYYTDWAELQVLSKNYNIALFLYGQALSIEPNNSQINQRIEQIRMLKKAL